jgi:ACS family glucarate transporter-like MFS transporter
MNKHPSSAQADLGVATTTAAKVSAAAAQSGLAANTRTRFRFVTLALITVVLALSSGDRAAMSVAGSDMAKELRITSVGRATSFPHSVGPM